MSSLIPKSNTLCIYSFHLSVMLSLEGISKIQFVGGTVIYCHLLEQTNFTNTTLLVILFRNSSWIKLSIEELCAVFFIFGFVFMFFNNFLYQILIYPRGYYPMLKIDRHKRTTVLWVWWGVALVLVMNQYSYIVNLTINFYINQGCILHYYNLIQLHIIYISFLLSSSYYVSARHLR